MASTLSLFLTQGKGASGEESRESLQGLRRVGKELEWGDSNLSLIDTFQELTRMVE